ncbi:hypothetical protein [Streptomyces sp. BK205]|uniref:hypothetical protein n=1 Tax=Streptomyces sp. BK205 TaxID=2512164 RepID=UPI0010510ED6|nr:hypothetical protein [Streptomyces sp. BK205]
MRYLNPEWLQASTSAAMHAEQRGLLERVLSALDGSSHLGQNVATLPSALVALIRAQAALESHGSVGQPRWQLLGRVVDAAISSTRQAARAYRLGGRADLALADAEMVAIASLISQRRDSTPQSQTRQAAIQLDRLLVPLSEAIKGWVKPLWTGAVSDRYLAEQMAAEIGVLVALEGRDTTALYTDLVNLISCGAVSADAVKSALWPPNRSHRVTLAVHGTRELRGLATFLPGSQQWGLWVGQEEDKLPTRAPLRKFVRFVDPFEGSAVLVSIRIEAADPGTAARIARRELSEALDHYAAGDRLIDLQLAPTWSVESPSDRHAMGTVRSPGRRTAYPLTGYMPDSLRAAMRAANLARHVDAPMASAALSWSALETTGLAANKVERLARACALQTLRRHLASTHAVLRSAARARLDHQRHAVEMEKVQLKKHETAAHFCARSDSLNAKAALSTHVELAATARARLERVEMDLQDTETAITSDMAALGAYVTTEGSKEHLKSVDAWLDVLLPAQSGISSCLQAAKDAVTDLATRCEGLAAETLSLWRSRLAAPKDLANWLEIQAGTYRSVLEWLYATRNMVIHKGHFTAPSDELTAFAARGVVDMALEFLSNWHTVERARAGRETPAAEVYQRLGDRLTDVITELRRPGAACHSLRVDYLTGPDSTWWTTGSVRTSAEPPTTS